MDHKSITRSNKQHKVVKNWGHEIWFHNDEKYCGKELLIRSGNRSSKHFHIWKTETILVTHGVLELLLWEDAEEFTHLLHDGDSVLITPGLVHQLIAPKGDVTLYEFSTQHFDEDSYRISR